MPDDKNIDDGVELTPQQKKMRRTRNIAIAVALAAFVAIIYAVTVAKLGVNVLKRPI
ncbi:hypothetical protein GCM10019059_02580 [Camelimonas fluminis]|uniref:CoxF protein n=1 Tax=Camelimonas fluminis TaxID=1576911 RepID=A0ABV7UDB5_9HYPH|nr:hypothetical protein [Camelimonas fluminis]GHE47384.1 hypothetical protein GCM10019059_02580 [Camelimonas fluminis]